MTCSFRVRRTALLPALFDDELHPDLRSVDPDKFAAPERQSGGRQQQEELAGPQHIGRSLDLKLGAGFRSIEQNATASPGSVDTHEVDGMPVFEADPVRSPIFPFHALTLAAGSAASTAASALAAELSGGSKRIVYCAAET